MSLAYSPLPYGAKGGITDSLGVRGYDSGGYVPALDTLIAQGATVLRAFSVRQLRAGYAGSSGRLRGNGTGSPEADIGFINGALNKATVATLIANGGGTAAFWKTFYDQSTNATDATQTGTSGQPQYSELSFATGAIGGRVTTQISSYLDMPLGTLPQPCCFFLVFYAVTSGAVRYLVGTSAGSTNRFIATAPAIPSHNWGTSESASPAVVSNGKNTALFVSNGASSSIWINGTQVHSGDTGGTQLDMSGGRLGGNNMLANVWWATAGNAIAECIVFGSDPTGLAGWSDFQAATKAYFGTP